MDTQPEPAFDGLVYEAAEICSAPIAALSLLGSRRQWLKARIGVDRTETPIEQAVCLLASGSGKLLVIPDLANDPRTAENPLVTGEPRLRFYAGAPLELPGGLHVGSLCVADTVARPYGLNRTQEKRLLWLAHCAESMFHDRKRPAGRIGAADAAAPLSRGTMPSSDLEQLLQLRMHARTRGFATAEELLRGVIETLSTRREQEL
ncbi:GAF domain-containing protein [Roseomonas sp. WA12]